VDLPVYFNGQPQNIGVLLGEPSIGLIDVDLDHPRAVKLAPHFLPPTPMVFGRATKPRSHWVYRVTGPMATKKYRSKSAGMIVELRWTGLRRHLALSAISHYFLGPGRVRSAGEKNRS
jgi:hypothetical protein